MRVVLCNDHGVIEVGMQPGSYIFQVAEVEAPILLVELVGSEYEFNGERISMNEFAMRMVRAPLTETAR
jgi:hypothetical protein